MPYKSQLSLGPSICSGHFGDVYEGHDAVHGKVAVKVLRQGSGESTSEWAMRSEELLREAQQLKAATHPNIVQVLNILRDSTTDVLHLVMEFCDGGSTNTVCKNSPSPLYQVRKIATDACRGLEHVHSCGMIHRDIKPGNILRHGNTYKIGDFGLVSDNLVVGYASAAGYTSHLAPEVFDNPVTGEVGTTSRKSDVWAMGMTLYRLLNGSDFHIRQFKSKPDLRAAITKGGFGHSLEWLPHIPEGWRKFVYKTMHDDCRLRIPTALAMSQALARLPVEPRWLCRHAPSATTWTTSDSGRTITVKWNIHSPRKHEWFAVRSGGGKRDISVGGEAGKIISATAATAGLEAFFSNYS